MVVEYKVEREREFERVRERGRKRERVRKRGRKRERDCSMLTIKRTNTLTVCVRILVILMPEVFMVIVANW